MKRIAILGLALIPALSVFAYSDYSSHSDELSVLTVAICLGSLVLSIIVLVRWWRMANDVEKIREHLTKTNPKLTYLVAIGEKEEAEKAALRILSSSLYDIYIDDSARYFPSKANAMNKIIEEKLPKIQRLGIAMPDYVTSGEKFIDYLNSISGLNVPYREDTYETLNRE